MASWGDTLESLRRQLVIRAHTATAHLAGRPGFPDGEDLAQEVLTRLLSTYGEAALKTWPAARLHGLANKTLHNLVIDLCRRKPLELSPRPVSEDAGAQIDAVAPEPDPEDSAAGREMIEIFRGCFEGVLDENEQRFVELSFDLDSAPAAQEQLGWPNGMTEKTKLCHLRSRLVRRVMKCFSEKTRA